MRLARAHLLWLTAAAIAAALLAGCGGDSTSDTEVETQAFSASRLAQNTVVLCWSRTNTGTYKPLSTRQSGSTRQFREEVIDMRRLIAAVLSLLVVGGLGAQAAMADPDPGNNKNAVILTFTCGKDTFEVATITQNAALAVQLVDGGGVVMMVQITVVDRNTDEVIYAFEVPGFDHNKQQTTTCTTENPQFPDALQIMEVVFRHA